jgi:DNA-binding PadR family transcriptional regulator
MRNTQREVVSDLKLGHFSDPPLLVLASLADGPKRGHAMTQDILRMCGTRLAPGALYGAIARLEERGLIEPLPIEERRHPYKITEGGLAFLKAKLDTMNRVVSHAMWRNSSQIIWRKQSHLTLEKRRQGILNVQT